LYVGLIKMKNVTITYTFKICKKKGCIHSMACSAIGYHHRRDGLCDPTAAEVVGQVRRGLHRILGTAPRRPARSRSDPRRSNDSCRAAATQPDRMRKRRAARVGLGDTP
jgi:hypothetical protein